MVKIWTDLECEIWSDLKCILKVESKRLSERLDMGIKGKKIIMNNCIWVEQLHEQNNVATS